MRACLPCSSVSHLSVTKVRAAPWCSLSVPVLLPLTQVGVNRFLADATSGFARRPECRGIGIRR